jgi:hypothetical protein
LAVINQTDLENALSVSTVRAIFDDANNNTVSTAAVAAVIARAESQVYSYLATTYPDLPIPYTASPAPEVLRSAVLEFAIVYSRDRKPEYWPENSRERSERLKAAFDMCDRFAKARQVLYGGGASTTPANIGGEIRSGVTDDTGPPDKFFADGTGDF